MRRFCLIGALLLGCWSNLLWAQYQLTGRVVSATEEAEILPFATLQAFSGEQFVAFATADADGYFKLNLDNAGTYLFKVRSVGYKMLEKSFTLNDINPTEYFDFKLEVAFMEAIEITEDAIGMRFEKDTIIYQTEVYANGSEETLGDLLNKLPGVRVNKSGIQVNGRKLDKLLVNGKDIFKNQQGLATQHLAAAMVNEVQLLNNYSSASELRGFSDHDEIALNVELKEEFTGKAMKSVAVGGGIKERYSYDGNAFQFGKRSQLAIVASGNNVGESEFTLLDYLKFTGELLNASEKTLELDESLSYLALPSEPAQSRSAHVLAVNYLLDITPKIQFNLHNIANLQNQKQRSNSFTRFLSFNDPGFENSRRENEEHLFSSTAINLQYKPNQDVVVQYRLGYNPSGYSQQSDLENELAGVSQVFDENRGQRMQSLTHSLKIGGRINEKQYLELDYDRIENVRRSSLDILGNQPFLGLFDSASNASDFLIDQSTRHDQTTDMIMLSFKEKISDNLLHVFAGHEYTRNSLETELAGPGSPEENALLQNNVVGITGNHSSFGLKLTRKRKFLQYNLGTTLKHFNTKLNGVDRFRRLAFLPSLRLQLVFNPMHKLTFIYKRDNKLPTPISLLPGSYVEGFQRMTQGQLSINNFTITQQASARYFWFEHWSNTLFFAGINYFKNEGLINTNTLNQDGYLLLERIWGGNRNNLSFNVTANKKLRGIPWVLEGKSILNYGQSDRFIDSRPVTINSRLLENQVKLFSNHKAGLNSYVNVAVSRISNAVASAELETSVTRYTPELGVQYFFKNGLKFHTSMAYDYFTASNLEDRQVYNLSGGLTYKSKEWVYRVNGQNLLNLNGVNILQTQLSNGLLTESSTMDLPGYLLFEVQFSF